MAVIVTGMYVPDGCSSCVFADDDLYCMIYGNEDCPLKSIEGLIEKFNMVNGCGDFIATYDVIQIIKEYCGEE